jgi:hypothetical protein
MSGVEFYVTIVRSQTRRVRPIAPRGDRRVRLLLCLAMLFRNGLAVSIDAFICSCDGSKVQHRRCHHGASDVPPDEGAITSVHEVPLYRVEPLSVEEYFGCH